jgi:hypothetical protein
MNLVIDEKCFPLWLVPKSTISDERLKRIRDANATLDIQLEPSGELYIKPIAAPHPIAAHAK